MAKMDQKNAQIHMYDEHKPKQVKHKQVLSWLFTDPAGTEQHHHSFGVAFLASCWISIQYSVLLAPQNPEVNNWISKLLTTFTS